MTDSLLFPWSGHRLSNSSGSPQNASYFEVYDAGTEDQRTVYTDFGLTTAGAWPITADGGGLCPARYLGTGAYKVIAKKSDGSTLWTEDNLPGAIDTSSFGGTGTAAPVTPVTVVPTSRAIVEADFGTILSVNPTSGTVVLAFDDATGITNGSQCTVLHSGTADAVSCTFPGQGTRVLSSPGESLTVVCTGAAYVFAADKSGTAPTSYTGDLAIVDQITAAPSSPAAGACYLINGTPTGTLLTLGFQENDIARADGNGSYIRYRPSEDCGWIAYVKDENVNWQYQGTAWVSLSNVTAPDESALNIAIWSDEKATNTTGGTSVDDAWTTHALQTERTNTITGASLASNQFTLPTGKYKIDCQMSAYAMTETQIRLYSVTNATSKGASVQVYTANYTSGTGPASILSGAALSLCAYVNVTAASETFALQYYTTVGGVASSLGRVRNIGSENEVYALVTVLDLTSLQGPAGEQGATGNDGIDAGYAYQWSTSTSGDPGSGKIAGNNATIASITQIAVSETDRAGNAMAAILATWDDSTSSVKATVTIRKESAAASADMHEFQITGAGTDQGSYWTFPVTYVVTNGTISNGNDVAVLVVPKGDKGDKGDTGETGATGATGPSGSGTAAAGSSGQIQVNYSATTTGIDTGLYFADAYGVLPNGSDMSSALTALLATIYTAGGGTIVFRAGTYRFDSTITFPNDGASPVARQVPMAFRGAGNYWSGQGGAITGSTIFDCRSTASDGRIQALGLGRLAIEGITFKDGSGSPAATPFLLSTNTTLHVTGCTFYGNRSSALADQDAIVLGGTTTTLGNTASCAFQGYGTVIEKCYFDKVRRYVYCRVYCNGVVIRENTGWTLCGSNLAGGAAIELDGGAVSMGSNLIIGNIIEANHYVYGIKLTANAGQNTIINNGVYDWGGGTLAGVYLGATSNDNVVLCANSGAGINYVTDVATNSRNQWINNQQGMRNQLGATLFTDHGGTLLSEFKGVLFSGGNESVNVQPTTTQTAASILAAIKRSAAEASGPGETIWAWRYDGGINWGGANTAAQGHITTTLASATSWSNNGRKWACNGTGGTMEINSGSGGSYLDLKHYGVSFRDHTGALQGRWGSALGAALAFGSGLDVAIGREGAATLAVNDGSSMTAYADLKLRSLAASGTVKSGVYTVATLPAAGTAGAGARAFVTDATQTHTAGVGAVVAGGGANSVPVYSDGTSWRIG